MVLAAGAIPVHFQWMIRPRADHLIHVRAETQRLVSAATAPKIQLDRQKRRVLDLDRAAFRRRFEPERALDIALQHRREQADHRLAPDRAPLIKPGSVALDEKGQNPFPFRLRMAGGTFLLAGGCLNQACGARPIGILAQFPLRDR